MFMFIVILMVSRQGTISYSMTEYPALFSVEICNIPGYDNKLHSAVMPLIEKLQFLRSIEPPRNRLCFQAHPHLGM